MHDWRGIAYLWRRWECAWEGCRARGEEGGAGSGLLAFLSGGGRWVHECFFCSSLNDAYNYVRSFVCNDIFLGKNGFKNK